jgi:hypothetical protein
MPDILIRFVRSHSVAEGLISWKAGTCMPFAPTHVECVDEVDGTWIGQHGFGGMQARVPGYDHDTVEVMPDGRRCEIVVRLPATQTQFDSFYSYVHDKLGMPYDWTSILGFAFTQTNFHTVGHLVCSAIMAAALRHCGYLQWPMTVPFHLIDPRDLLLILSTHVEISH